MCVPVRREGISLGAKRVGAGLRQHVARELAKAGTVAGLILSAKPQLPFLAGTFLVHLAAPAWPAKTGTVLGRMGAGLWPPGSLPLTFLFGRNLVSHLLCGTVRKITPVGIGTRVQTGLRHPPVS